MNGTNHAQEDMNFCRKFILIDFLNSFAILLFKKYTFLYYLTKPTKIWVVNTFGEQIPLSLYKIICFSSYKLISVIFLAKFDKRTNVMRKKKVLKWQNQTQREGHTFTLRLVTGFCGMENPTFVTTPPNY